MIFLGEVKFKGKSCKVVTRLGWICRGRIEEEDEYFISIKDERDKKLYTFNKHEIAEISELDGVRP